MLRRRSRQISIYVVRCRMKKYGESIENIREMVFEKINFAKDLNLGKVLITDFFFPKN